MKRKEELKALIRAYRDRGAARDQNELVQLLREAQALYDGVLPRRAMEKVAEKLDLKMTFLDALLRHYPSIRTEDALHTLTLCDGKKCAKSGALVEWIRQTYGVEPNGTRAGFRCKTAGCMKACSKGPCVKWDGELHTEMTKKKLRRLIEGEG